MTELTYREKKAILDHITLGKDEVFYYPYHNGEEPLPLRPLTSLEMDKCFYNALETTNKQIAEFVVKIKLNLIKQQQEVTIANNDYKTLQEFHDKIDYWVVYHGMKDFQPEEFRQPNYDDFNEFPNGFYIVQDMEDVHKIANLILNASYRNEEVIKQIFSDEMGREVAIKVTYLKQPLGKIGDLTKLQEKYLIYSEGHLQKILKGEAKKSDILRKDKSMKLKDFLQMI